MNLSVLVTRIGSLEDNSPPVNGQVARGISAVFLYAGIEGLIIFRIPRDLVSTRLEFSILITPSREADELKDLKVVVLRNDVRRPLLESTLVNFFENFDLSTEQLVTVVVNLL